MSSIRINEIGLPRGISDEYIKQGIYQLYDWQINCLKSISDHNGDVSFTKNLVYSAPTGGGKTLVAELVLLARLSSIIIQLNPTTTLNEHIEKPIKLDAQMCILIVPYVSIVLEKESYFKKVCKSASGYQFQGFYQNSSMSVDTAVSKLQFWLMNEKSLGKERPFDVALCTIEKANQFINLLISNSIFDQLIGLVIVDEVHIITDQQRGTLLKVLLSKILYTNSLKETTHFNKKESGISQGVQIIAMSATLIEIDEVGNWLKAHVFRSHYRPVALTEHIVCEKRLYKLESAVQEDADQMIASDHHNKSLGFNHLLVRPQWKEVRPLPWSCQSTDGFLAITLDSMAKGLSCLIFCSSKKGTEETAKDIARALKQHHIMIDNSGSSDVASSREKLKTNLVALAVANGALYDSDNTNVDESMTALTLSKLIPLGIAFHNSCLTSEERRFIENAFRNKTIVVLCATSTVAAGVNLPAHRVIFKSPYIAKDFLDTTRYRQMSGRAGRKGLVEAGESFLLCRLADLRRAFELVEGKRKPRAVFSLEATCHTDSDPAQSDHSCLQRSLLEIIAAGTTSRLKKECESQTPLNSSEYSTTTIKALAMLSSCLFSSENQEFWESASTLQSRNGTNEYQFLPNPNEVPSKAGETDQVDASHVECASQWDTEESKIERALDSLMNMGQIVLINDYYEATLQGRAVAMSGLNPVEGFLVYKEADRVAASLILEGSLQLAYLCCPFQYPLRINWLSLRKLFNELSPIDKAAAESIGIDILLISSAVVEGAVPKSIARDTQVNQKYCRFYCALLCVSLIQAKPFLYVAKTFGVTRGDIQTSVASFGSMTITLFERLGWWALAALIRGFLPLLQFGTSREYLQLMEVPGMTLTIARALHRGGLRSVTNLASSPTDRIKQILLNGGALLTKKGNLPKLVSIKIRRNARLHLSSKVYARLEFENKREDSATELNHTQVYVSSTTDSIDSCSHKSVIEDLMNSQETSVSAERQIPDVEVPYSGIAITLPVSSLPLLTQSRKKENFSADDVSQRKKGDSMASLQCSATGNNLSLLIPGGKENLMSTFAEGEITTSEVLTSDEFLFSDSEKGISNSEKDFVDEMSWSSWDTAGLDTSESIAKAGNSQCINSQCINFHSSTSNATNSVNEEDEEEMEKENQSCRSLGLPRWKPNFSSNLTREKRERLEVCTPRVDWRSSRDNIDFNLREPPYCNTMNATATTIPGESSIKNCKKKKRGASLLSYISSQQSDSDRSHLTTALSETQFLRQLLTQIGTSLLRTDNEEVVEDVKSAFRTTTLRTTRSINQTPFAEGQSFSQQVNPLNVDFLTAKGTLEYFREDMPQSATIDPLKETIRHRHLFSFLNDKPLSPDIILSPMSTTREFYLNQLDQLKTLFRENPIISMLLVCLHSSPVPYGYNQINAKHDNFMNWGLLIAFGTGDTWFVRFDQDDEQSFKGKSDQKFLPSFIVSWLLIETHLCIVPSAHVFHKMTLQDFGFECQCSFFDPFVCQWILDPDNTTPPLDNNIILDLRIRVQQLCQLNNISIRCSKNQSEETEEVLKQLSKTLWSVFLVSVVLSTHLQTSSKLSNLFWTVEMPFSKCLASMELNGLPLMSSPPQQQDQCEDNNDPFDTNIDDQLSSIEELVTLRLAHLESLTDKIEGQGLTDIDHPHERHNLNTVLQMIHSMRSAIISPQDDDFSGSDGVWSDDLWDFDSVDDIPNKKQVLASDPKYPNCLGCVYKKLKKTNSLPLEVNLMTTGACEDGSLHFKNNKHPSNPRRLFFSLNQTSTGHVITTKPNLMICLMKRFGIELPPNVPLMQIISKRHVYGRIHSLLNPYIHEKKISKQTTEEEQEHRREIIRVLVTHPTTRMKNKKSIPHLRIGQLIAIHLHRSMNDPFVKSHDSNCHQTLFEDWAVKGFGTYDSSPRPGFDSIFQVDIKFKSRILTYPSNQISIILTPNIKDLIVQQLVSQTMQNEFNVAMCLRQLVTAPSECSILCIEYSQLEFRLLTELSNDTEMKSFLFQSNDPIIKLTSGWIQSAEVEVTPQQRASTKCIVYGIIDGLSATSLGQALKISTPMAAQLMASFLDRYEGLIAWIERHLVEVQQSGYVESILGRRRYLNNINSRNPIERRRAQRQAINTACQSSASDFLKIAMLKIHNEINRWGSSLLLARSFISCDTIERDDHSIHHGCLAPARLILQLHDEFIFEVRNDSFEFVKLLDLMVNAMKLTVPIKVKWKRFHNWDGHIIEEGHYESTC